MTYKVYYAVSSQQVHLKPIKCLVFVKDGLRKFFFFFKMYFIKLQKKKNVKEFIICKVTDWRTVTLLKVSSFILRFDT